MKKRPPFSMKFDIATIKHLGLQMYSTLPSVISELVANSWDAEATEVRITIPKTVMSDSSQIIVQDNGEGMTDKQVRESYLIVGRDRRIVEKREKTFLMGRPIMGRKGIGKFAGFGIAQIIEVETVPSKGDSSHFQMDYKYLEAMRDRGNVEFDHLSQTSIQKGTKVTLKNITKFRERSVNIDTLRKRLARRFSIIGSNSKFSVIVNGKAISIKERDLKKHLDSDHNDNLYLWEYQDNFIDKGKTLKISGWIGALKRTDSVDDGIDRGIAIMARGKLVQEPFTFDAVVGQQFALSYLIGELHAEFVDQEDDTIGTTRNTLVWDTPNNRILLEWGKKEVNKIAREWAGRRSEAKQIQIKDNLKYKEFVQKANDFNNPRIIKIFDNLVKNSIANSTPDDKVDTNRIVQIALDYMEFDQFWDMAQEIEQTDINELKKIFGLFKEWEVVEAKEMMKITEGRIKTISKFETLIEEEAREVPEIHGFLKEFPWVLDPRWTLVSDEIYYSSLLKKQFPGSSTTLEKNRRIDFLCVRESNTLVVVEIKRPGISANKKDLDQIESYVAFLRGEVEKSTSENRIDNVIGYLLCTKIANNNDSRQKQRTLSKDGIHVKNYGELLSSVKNLHREFLDRSIRVDYLNLIFVEK